MKKPLLLILSFLLNTVQAQDGLTTLNDTLKQQLTQLQTEINATFALYELQIATCLQASQLIKKTSLQTLEHNLRQLQTLQTLLTTQELSIAELHAIRSQLQLNLSEVNQILKKLRRRIILERIASSAVIATLTYILLTRPP